MDVLQMSLSASVLIVAVVIIRALTLYRLPKKMFTALWGVVVCRLLIPFSVSPRFSFFPGMDMAKSIFDRRTAASSKIHGIPGFVNIPGMEELTKTNAAAVPMPLVKVIWLIGMCACGLFFIAAYIKCCREFRMSLPVENDYIASWLREHPLRRPVQIRQSDRIKAPLTYGVFRPVVLLPKKTDWEDETRLRYVLTHEFTHIRHFDMPAKLALTAAVCVHWFNPLVWVTYVLANRDIELSCDETVVRTFGETVKQSYAMTLIGLEERKSMPVPFVNNFSKYSIEERINAIMKMKTTTLLGKTIAFALVLGTILTAFVTPAAAVGVDGSNVHGIYDPKSYYGEKEAVFIGTGKEQDAYNPCDEAGDPVLVKRIIIDEQDKVTAVVPVENQLPENFTPDMSSAFIAVNGYENVYTLSANDGLPRPYYVFRQTAIGAPSVWIAVIPAEWQIKNK